MNRLMPQCTFISHSSCYAVKTFRKCIQRQVLPQLCRKSQIHLVRIIFRHDRQIPAPHRAERHTAEHPVLQDVPVARPSQVSHCQHQHVAFQIQMLGSHSVDPPVVILSQISVRVVRPDGQGRAVFPFLQHPHLQRERAVLLVELRLTGHVRCFQQRFAVSQFQKGKQGEVHEVVSRMVTEGISLLRHEVSSDHECSRFVHFRCRSHQSPRHAQVELRLCFHNESRPAKESGQDSCPQEAAFSQFLNMHSFLHVRRSPQFCR